MQTESTPDPIDLAVETYLRFKGTSRKKNSRKNLTTEPTEGSQPFTPGRDPNHIASIVNHTAQDLGWTISLSQAELLHDWGELVGDEVAAQTRVTGIREETLFVECSSTAWATQLRLMRGTLLAQISEKYPEAGVQHIRFIQPASPSWKKGPRTVSGRGPRDTYG